MRATTSTKSTQIWRGSYPAQTVGSIVSATRSRSERRSSARSLPCVRGAGVRGELLCVIDRLPPAPQLGEHFVRRNEEWVLLQQPSDDHHRVRSHDVHHDACAKLGEIVRS